MRKNFFLFTRKFTYKTKIYFFYDINYYLLVPEVAKQHEIMSVNSTSVTLYLDNWPSSECPIQYFKLAYRNTSKWIFVDPSRLAPETVVIGGLNSATKYTLRVTAINEAGISKHDYVFATRTETGGIIVRILLTKNLYSFSYGNKNSVVI